MNWGSLKSKISRPDLTNKQQRLEGADPYYWRRRLLWAEIYM